MTVTAPTRPTRRSAAARALRAAVLAAIAAAATVAGVWVAGGLITNDFRLAMALTGAWFVTAGATALASFRAGRSIGAPLLAGYLIAAVATGGYLAATTLRDKTVDERVATGMPASALPQARGEAPANVEEARGSFTSGEPATRGIARVIRFASGRRVLTLTGFETSAGPDLRVRVAPHGTTGDAVDLGALKGTRGDQQYELPRRFGARGQTVLIWCRAFSALFGSARLEAS
jgi:hypothetical protein